MLVPLKLFVTKRTCLVFIGVQRSQKCTMFTISGRIKRWYHGENISVRLKDNGVWLVVDWVSLGGSCLYSVCDWVDY